MNEQEYIEQRLQTQIDWYSNRAKRNQQGYRWLRVLEVVLADAAVHVDHALHVVMVKQRRFDVLP